MRLGIAGSTALVLALLTAAADGQTNRYVVQDNPAAVPPYVTWETAAATIQDAVDAASAGDTVWVSNGLYATGGRPAPGMSLTNRVLVDKALTVLAVSANPADTTIAGAPHSAAVTNGNAAVRCVWLASGASLAGFTLTNGATRAVTGDDGRAGGVFAASSGSVVSHCVLINLSGQEYASHAYRGTYRSCRFARSHGGENRRHAYNATLFDCEIIGKHPEGYYDGGLANCTASNTLITRCWQKYGGAASGSTLFNCVVSNNYGGTSGGGVYNCTVYGSLLINNSSTGGGGAQDSTLTDCVLTGNSANSSSRSGGGAHGSTLTRCLLTGNTSVYGGGMRNGTANNCRFENNTATWNGGGAYGANLFNSLLVSNRTTTAGLYGHGGGAFNSDLYNCTVVQNFATNTGGGLCSGTVFNTILYLNTAASGNNYSGDPLFTNACTAPAAAGWAEGNIAADPGFRGAGQGDFSLRGDSPCLEAGWVLAWMTNLTDPRSLDLTGRLRVLPAGGRPDLGAFEAILRRGSLIKIN